MNRLLLSGAAFLGIFWLVDSSLYEALAVALTVYSFFTFVDRFGHQIALLDFISFIAALEILLVPAITYWIFPASMPSESTVYLRYALPAYAAFYVGINCVVSYSKSNTHESYIQRASAYLQQRPQTVGTLLPIGLAGFLVKSFAPTMPSFASTLPMYCLLTSALYAYYAKHPYRILVICMVISILLFNTIRTGMFGDLFFWLFLLLMFGAVRRSKPIKSIVKAVAFGFAVAFLLLIQSIKTEYRYHTWGNSRYERTTDASLMADLLVDRLTHPEKLLTVSHFFTAFVRFNQGIMIGSAMAKVPTHEAYAGGEVLLSFVYPLVPRVMWPGKPQTGGYENIRRFTTLPQFENTSINLSPLGEGYVNFGYGGILFSFVYGSLLGGCFRYLFYLSHRIPSVILWLPMLYAGCLTMETDLLSTWGSLLNSALFVLVLFGLLKRIGIEL